MKAAQPLLFLAAAVLLGLYFGPGALQADKVFGGWCKGLVECSGDEMVLCQGLMAGCVENSKCRQCYGGNKANTLCQQQQGSTGCRANAGGVCYCTAVPNPPDVHDNTCYCRNPCQ